MSIALVKTEGKKFAKFVADIFLKGKDDSNLRGITQEHIDAFVIPIMSNVEDTITSIITSKIQDSVTEHPLDVDDEWWTNKGDSA